MFRFEIIRRALIIGAAAALLFSSANAPRSAHAEKECLLFPQFSAAASADKTADGSDIEFAFGIAEIIKRCSARRYKA